LALHPSSMESPFKDLLHTNSIPSEAQCQGIREFLRGPCKKAADLTESIQNLQASLDELVRQRDQLNAFVDEHLALVSPVRRLPPDIVQEIFIACLPEDRNAPIDTNTAPLLLCRICRAWRHVTLSTPRLWASLHIAIPELDTTLLRLNDLIKVWIRRSGVLPLSISVAGPPFDTDVSPLLSTLIAVSRRWEHINLSFTSHGSFAPLGALSSSDAPILRTVRIDTADVDSSPELESNGWNKLVFLETPSLCRFSGWSARANFSRLPLGGEQLRHLDLRYASLSAQEALTLLRRCPSLVTCTLYFSNDHPASLDLGPPCRLEYLQQFCAVSSGGFTHSPQAFFESLSLPNLRVLEIFGTISVGSLRLPFLRLLSSTNGLEQLSLRSSHLTSDMIAEGLRHTPQLQELCVCYGDSVDDRLLALLADTPRDLCPNLRRLRLLNMYQLSDEAILNLLRARSIDADGVANLESVYVRIHRPIQLDILPLAPPGIDLILAYPDNDEPVYDSSRGVESDGMAWAPISGGW
ncbi:hypothetical protein C8J57DRAFT_1348246, partial [Mycena rebaudengoi]